MVEENETGKSTLAAAILAGLCGFPTRRRPGETMKLLDVYRPWDDGPYAVELRIEAGQRRYVVERDFARGTFVVREAETNRDVTAQFEQDLSLHFLKLPRDDYLRIAFICGKDVSRFDSSTSLKARLSALIEGSGESAGAESAIALLEGTGYTLEGSEIKIDTAISRLTRNIEQKTRLMTELDTALESAAQDVSLLDSAQARRSELTSKLQLLDAEHCAARLRETQERIASADADAASIAEYRKELESLQRYATFPAERSTQLAAAAERLRQQQSELEEAQTKLGELAEREDELRASTEPLKQFALATEDDLTGLRTAREQLGIAASAAERAAEEMERETRSGRAYAAKALIALGLLGALACLLLMVLHVLDVTPCIIGAAAGAAAAVGGLAWLSGARTRAAKTAGAVQQAESHLAEAREIARRRLAVLGVECTPGADLGDLLFRTETSLSNYMRDRSALAEVQRSLESLRRAIADAQQNIDSERAAIQSILSDAGIDTSLPLSDALREFGAAEKRYRRMRELRDTLLPALEARAMSAETLERLKAEESDLVSRLAACPEIETSRSSSEIDAERTSVRSELAETDREIRDIERRVGVIVDKYRREYPPLQEEVRSLQIELERAKRFDRALKLAASVMREVAEDTRRRWAAALNEQAGEILPHLNPDYDSLLFDDSLDFTLRHIADKRIIQKREADAQLSTGARDQIYFAVRLACCRELSRLGEPIPIILDDPLIAADDERFALALRYLVETLAREQQVIILSCHRSRHERFCEEDWFRESVEMINLSQSGTAS